MIKAFYPIKHATSQLEVVMESPKLDPESKYGDFRCACRIQCEEYKKEFYAHGIDALQCSWIGLKMIRKEIEVFEDTTNQTCEYTYFEEERFLHKRT